MKRCPTRGGGGVRRALRAPCRTECPGGRHWCDCGCAACGWRGRSRRSWLSRCWRLEQLLCSRKRGRRTALRVCFAATDFYAFVCVMNTTVDSTNLFPIEASSKHVQSKRNNAGYISGFKSGGYIERYIAAATRARGRRHSTCGFRRSTQHRKNK
jgi:hypothetical protein